MSATPPPSGPAPSGSNSPSKANSAAPSPVGGKVEKTATPKGRKRRRWLRWLLVFLFLLVLLIGFLPNILSLPMFRQRILDRIFSRYNAQVTVGELSLAWFSAPVVGDFKLQVEESSKADIAVDRIEGNVSLLRLLFGRDLGTFRVVKPNLNIEFNKDGTNLSRLLRAMAGASFINRPAKLLIENGSMQLKGRDSPQPWQVAGVNLNMSLTPAADSPAGVLTLQGDRAQLLSEMNLTPEMCNDLLKFLAPALNGTTRAIGRVSLVIDDYTWPLGKPEATELSGRLTLHSVEVGPGGLLQSLAGVVELKNWIHNVQISKDDVVTFSMRKGVIDHQNLKFGLAGLQAVSHGSVGLDESLDWFVDLQIQALGGAGASDNPLLIALQQQRPTVHYTGTLSKYDWKLEGVSMSAFRVLLDFIKRRADRREEPQSQSPQPQTPRPAILPRNRGEAPIAPPAAK